MDLIQIDPTRPRRWKYPPCSKKILKIWNIYKKWVRSKEKNVSATILSIFECFYIELCFQPVQYLRLNRKKWFCSFHYTFWRIFMHIFWPAAATTCFSGVNLVEWAWRILSFTKPWKEEWSCETFVAQGGYFTGRPCQDHESDIMLSIEPCPLQPFCKEAPSCWTRVFEWDYDDVTTR